MAAGKSGWSKGSLEELKAMALPMDACDCDNLWRGSLCVELEMLAKVTQLLKDVEGKLDRIAEAEHRQQYYDLLQAIRTKGQWEEWLEFFMKAVKETAETAVDTANQLMCIAEEDRRKTQTPSGLYAH